MMLEKNLPVRFFERLALAGVCLAGTILIGCSSAPEPQPQQSKQEIRQDAEGFFHKMEQEEDKQSPSP